MNSPTRAGAVVTALSIAVLLSIAGTATAQSDQTYYDEDFSNKSFGEEVYHEEFEFGKAGWTVDDNSIYMGNSENQYYVHDGSEIVVSQDLTGWDGWGAHQSVSRDISFPTDGTYYYLVTSDAFFENNSYGASVDDGDHQLTISGGTHTIHNGTSLVTTGTGSGTRTVKVESNPDVPYNGPDEPVTMQLRVDELQIIKQARDPQRTWEAQNFIVYIDDGIDGKSIHGRDFYGELNVSPAHKADGPVVLEFDIKTSGSSASWSATQLGTTVGSGSITAGTNRKVRQEVDLQSGELRLDVNAKEAVAVDNIRVHGPGVSNASTSGNGFPAPSVGVLSSADADSGRSWGVGLPNNLLDVAYMLLQWGSAIALALGLIGMIYSRNHHRNQRGHTLFVGGIIGVVLAFGFPMAMTTFGWVATGQAETAPLDEPGFDATAVKYSEDFEEPTFSNTGWELASGSSGDVFIESEGDDKYLRFQGDGATIEREITVERGESVPAATLALDAEVTSTLGSQPPDRDAVNVTVISDGKHVVDERTAVTASGGDTVRDTATTSFNLTSSTITVQVTATDLNGDDGTVDIAVDDIEIQSLVAN